ncbi:MAG TPA: nitroreductase family protein, partial [Candidatus Bathyarchaeia archaeon]|nr:nitroreductase family protein [Candidatus Bathyarchaeia archaeon]
ASANVVIAMTSMAWRNSWKYQERSYRHWFWDSGVVAANLLATCFSAGLSARLLVGFVDSEINQLLGLKAGTEATVALAAIGLARNELENRAPKKIPEIDLKTEPLSKDKMEYPIIWETNKASELQTQTAVREWQNSFHQSRNDRPMHEPAFPLQMSNEDTPSLAKVILQRGSTRKFAQRPISFESLSTIIDVSSKNISLDFLHKSESLIDFYLIANDVQDLPPGSYFFSHEKRSLEQLKEGKMRYISGYLSLEQLLFSDASAVFFLMTDLDLVLGDLGDRGYRAAQFEAGVRAGKIYLSSYAMGIGASGTTFYDDAVTEFFSPHATGMSTMIAVGVGVPAYKARPGRVLPQFDSSSG